MVIYKFDSVYPSLFHRPVVTIGIFDGVHRGHKYILSVLRTKAQLIEGEPVVITLWPHPRMVLYPEKQIKLLSTFEEKIHLLEKEGIQKVVVIDFDLNFSKIPAKEFIEMGLIKKLGMKSLVLGFDNHFGHNKEGKVDVVKEESQRLGFDVIKVNPVFEGEESISSTNIRLFLELGDIEIANTLLGYNYFVTGKVVEGDKLGRTINFPTANITVPEFKMLPRIGVYAVFVKIDGRLYKGMLNIGFRPTINQSIKTKTMEVHVIDFEGDLYNKDITLTFVSRIRDEVKFSGLDELKAQLELDKKRISKLLEEKQINTIII